MQGVCGAENSEIESGLCGVHYEEWAYCPELRCANNQTMRGARGEEHYDRALMDFVNRSRTERANGGKDASGT